MSYAGLTGLIEYSSGRQ